MNKTFTINLNNSVYHIDEDAYQVLQNYLLSLKEHFRDEEGADEILSDIEARISELFNERIRYGMQVITLHEVNDVIAIMGHPEDFEKELPDDSSGNTENKTGEEEIPPEPVVPAEPVKTPKRLFRDPDNRILGGVASGLGYYLGIDPTLIRILFLAMAFLWGSSIWIYILLWAFVPEAKTAAQKLQMKGEPVTVDTIKRMVTDEIGKSGEMLNGETNKPRTFFEKAGDIFISIIRGLFKLVFILFGGCLGFILLMVLFALGASALSVLFAGLNLSAFEELMDPQLYSFIQQTGNPVPWLIAILLTFGIPLYALLRVIIGNLLHKTPQSRHTTRVLWILWGIGVVLLIYYSVKLMPVLMLQSSQYGII